MDYLTGESSPITGKKKTKKNKPGESQGLNSFEAIPKNEKPLARPFGGCFYLGMPPSEDLTLYS
jgi:hypothetical protein